MRNVWFILLLLPFVGFAQPNNEESVEKPAKFRTVTNNAFQEGEVLEYRVHYGFIDAGTARIEVKNSAQKIAGREVYHIVGTGKTRGGFDWFFKVRDYYETYVDKQGVFPWVFVRRVNEGGYKINQDYIFHQNNNLVKTQKNKKYNTPDYVQDMLSAFYYARTKKLRAYEVGDTVTVHSFVDGEVWPLQMKYIGRDTITVDKGRFACMKYNPIVQEGRIFKKEEDLIVWITDDANKIPILAQAKILVGSIKMEIQHYEGLANPVAVTDK